MVHSIIELKNGLRIFLYHEPDMRIPIANAIEDSSKNLENFKFNYKKISNNLTFLSVDKIKFPVEEIIKKINLTNSSPILVNAANEIIVDQFLKKKIKFTDIFKYLKLFLNTIEYIKTSKIKPNSIEKVRKIDFIGRQLALKLININV